MGGTSKANTTATATATSLIVEILIPSHISVSAAQRRQRRFLPSVSFDDDGDGDGDDDDDLKQQQKQFHFCLHCYYSGSMWRGIAPILLEAQTEWAQRFIYLLSLSYSPKSTNSNENRPNLTDSRSNNNIINNETNKNNKKHIENGDDNEDHEADNEHENEGESNTPNNNVLYRRRRISYPKTNAYQNKIIKHLNINHNNLQNNGKQKQSHDGSNTTIDHILVTIWIQPPDISMKYSSIDRIFGSLVNRHEKLLIQKQTLSAWMSTLGGGYFFCRRLSKSLLLSQQQQLIAKQLNNHHLQQQCQINEIFNWLYIGNFQMALTKIAQLENEISIVSTTTISPPPPTSSSSSSSSSSNNINNANLTTITTTNNTVYRQCQAARVLADRLQKFQRKLHKYHTGEHGIVHAIDDYQRIRLVQEDFE